MHTDLHYLISWKINPSYSEVVGGQIEWENLIGNTQSCEHVKRNGYAWDAKQIIKTYCTDSAFLLQEYVVDNIYIYIYMCVCVCNLHCTTQNPTYLVYGSWFQWLWGHKPDPYFELDPSVRPHVFLYGLQHTFLNCLYGPHTCEVHIVHSDRNSQ
jgi:hypothetical protein